MQNVKQLPSQIQIEFKQEKTKQAISELESAILKLERSSKIDRNQINAIIFMKTIDSKLQNKSIRRSMLINTRAAYTHEGAGK